MPWNFDFEVEVEIEEPEVEYEVEYEVDYGFQQPNHNIQVDYNAGHGYNQEPDHSMQLVDTGNYKQWGQKNNQWSCGWTGWFAQNGQKSNMHFENFQIDFNGSIWGHGADQIGKFNISGKMNMQNNHFTFHKQYVGQHNVVYQGSMNQGLMVGKWSIPGNCQGNFQIRCDSPSWSGCFWQGGNRQNMKLDLQVSQHGVFGMGFDQVGSFMCRGSTNGSQVQFAKQYFGQHTVFYNGEWHGNNIKGMWQIPGNCQGKFQLHK